MVEINGVLMLPLGGDHTMTVLQSQRLPKEVMQRERPIISSSE